MRYKLSLAKEFPSKCQNILKQNKLFEYEFFLSILAFNGRMVEQLQSKMPAGGLFWRTHVEKGE